MKTNIMKTVNTIKKSILVIALALGFTAANAGTGKPVAEKEPTVTSLGVVSGQVVFNLKYDNIENENVEVALTDKDGNRFYRQVFSEKNLNKTFKVPAEVESFVVRVTNLKTKAEQRFEISTQHQFYQEVTVKSVR
jgi:hypothetical protein